jgi:chromatin remodeling complex protein RSC6
MLAASMERTWQMVSPMQVLEDEKVNLMKAEERLKNLAAEAAQFAANEAAAAAVASVQPPVEGDQPAKQEGAEGEQSPAALLQERQREAEEKVARLRMFIAGPPQLEVCHALAYLICRSDTDMGAGICVCLTTWCTVLLPKP